MPVGRVFSDLTIFDLLGNFVPGIVLLSGIILLLPPDRFQQVVSGSLGVFIFLSVVAFALGHLVQSYAAEAVGKRGTFKYSILAIQSMGQAPKLDFSENPSEHPRLYGLYKLLHPAENPTSSCLKKWLNSTNEGILYKILHLPARLFRSIAESVLLVRIKRDRPLEDLTLAAKAWTICRNRYDIDSNFKEYGDLLHLMSSELEDTEYSSRALRFQAIRNFQRGMWITFHLTAVLFLSVAIAQTFPNLILDISQRLGLSVWKPIIVDFWRPIWMLVVGCILLSYLFWELKEDYEEEFVEYLIVDFVTSNSDHIGEEENQSGVDTAEVEKAYR